MDTVVVITNYFLFEPFKSSFIKNRLSWNDNEMDGSKYSWTLSFCSWKEPVLAKGHADKLTNQNAKSSQQNQYIPVPYVSGTCKLFLELLS